MPTKAMKKSPRRRRKSSSEKLHDEWQIVAESKTNEVRLASFRKAYLENGMNAYRAGLAIGMKPRNAKEHSHRYARLIKIEIREALTAMGYGPEKLTKLFVSCLNAKSKSIRLQALDRAFKVRDDYPVPIPVPPQGPVTVIFNTNLASYEGVKYAAHKIIEQGSLSNEPQGNAGSRASEGAIPGSRVLDAEKSQREAQA